MPAEVIAISPAPTFDAWISTGRQLAAQRRDVDWQLGDWLTEGRTHGFLDQANFDFLADNLGIAPRRLKTITKAVDAFPPHLRDTSMAVEHHAHVADLPRDQQLELLTQARRDHWSEDDLRKQVITRKTETGIYQTVPIADAEHHALMQLQHAWNCAPRSVRLEFAEIIADIKGAPIDA